MKKVAQYAVELADREAIRDCLYRYCRAVDRNDVELGRTLYWSDASIDYGENLQFSTAEAVFNFMAPIWQVTKMSKHMYGNALIEIAGDQAWVETYHYSIDCGTDPQGNEYERASSGRYLDQLERRADEWRFKHRIHILDWNRVWEVGADGGALARLAAMEQNYVGHQQPDDRSYQALLIGVHADR